MLVPTRSRRVLAIVVAALLCVSAAAGTAWAGPDLVVSDIVLEPAAPGPGSGTLTATITNQGDSKAGGVTTAINVQMFLDGIACDTGLIFLGISAGSSANEETGSCNPDTPGPHEITFVVDTDGDVDEDDEGNNSLTKTFTWAGPDLVVTSVSLDPPAALAGTGTLTATLENVGPIGTPLNLIDPINVTFWLDGEYCDDGWLLGSMGAGAVAYEETGSCNPTGPGPHEVTVMVDSDEQVAETDELNNTFVTSITWGQSLYPDLVITGITLEPEEPGVGDGTLTATVVNQGNDGTGLLNLDIEMLLDGEPCATGLVLGGLGAGSTAKEETGACNPETPGEHEITFIVDSTGEVAESDELNNSLTATFTWVASDLVVTGIVLDPPDAKAGEGTIIATVANQGPVGTPVDLLDPINVAVRVDGEPCDTGWIIGGLGAGAEQNENFGGCDVSAGSHTVEVFIDSDMQVVELDEANNVLSVTLTWGQGEGGGPDDPPVSDDEVCNGLDDDQDGETDEDWPELGVPCDGSDDDSCADGVRVCSGDGKSTSCSDDPVDAAELCNGQDDDCDGETDEDWPEVGGACEITDGPCIGAGTIVCAADLEGTTCAGEVQSGSAEVCNGLDDDCDGNTDEEWPHVGAACFAGRGACKTWGAYACGAAGVVECDAVAVAAASESCDDLVDNDCDGATDEGCYCEPGQWLPCGTDIGACVAGFQQCEDIGRWAAECEGAIWPAVEICDNGIDDSCEGHADEGCSCNTGQGRLCDQELPSCVGEGLQACINSVRLGCDADVSAVCTCTDTDSRPCDDPPPDGCADYVQDCRFGTWQPCTPIPGTEDPVCTGGGTGGADAGATDAGGAAGGGSTASDVGPTSGGVGADVTAGGGGVASASSGGCAGSPAGPTGAPLVLLACVLWLQVRRRGERMLAADPGI